MANYDQKNFYFNNCSINGEIGQSRYDAANYEEFNTYNKNTATEQLKKQRKKNEEDADNDNIPISSKESKDQNRYRDQKTKIEAILQMQEESSKCCDTECDYGTCGIMRAQYHLGAEISFLPVLINYFDALLKTEHDGALVETIYHQIATTLITKLKVSVEECNLYAEKNYKQKNYFKAILFHLIAGQLLPTTKDVSRVLHGVQAFMLGIKLCIMKIAEECSFYKNIVRLRILPKMRILLRSVCDVMSGRSRKDLVMVEVLCMHHLEISEGFVGDLDASEATLIASLDRLEDVLGEEAKTVRLYGAALNNLGATYLRKRKPEKAISQLNLSITVNSNATDYTSEEERRNDLQMTRRALDRADNMKSRLARNE